MQLIQDYEDYEEVNKQLEKMGYNIGTRLIEDFLAKSNLGRCSDFKEVGEVIAKVCDCTCNHGGVKFILIVQLVCRLDLNLSLISPLQLHMVHHRLPRRLVDRQVTHQ